MNDIRALLGGVGIWGHLASMPAPRLRPFVGRAAELRYGTLWVGEATARDPFAQLGALAEASDGMTLGTSIVNIFGRDAMAAKMGAMTLHELTGGRFILGLGVSHVHLVEKLRGHAYERPLTHMREYLEAYRRLPYRGPTLSGDDGQPTESPVLLAALRRRMLELAATAADGALPFLVSTPRVAWMREVLDAAAPADYPRPVLAVTLPVVIESDPGRARLAGRAWIEPYCRAVNYQASLSEQGFSAADWAAPYSDRLIDAIVAWGDTQAVRARIDAMHDAGADHVAVIPLAEDGSAEHLPTLEALAPRA
ncbi:LLM class F420-dependent oxidoreductase [soil metagenome]